MMIKFETIKFEQTPEFFYFDFVSPAQLMSYFVGTKRGLRVYECRKQQIQFSPQRK